MQAAPFHVWQVLGLALHMAGAIAAATVAIWLLGRRNRFGPAGTAVVCALVLTAIWGLAVVTLGGTTFVVSLAEAFRNLGWLFALYRLFALDGRHASMAPIRPVVIAVAFVELLYVAIDLIMGRAAPGHAVSDVAFDFVVMFRLLASIGALLLVHNLYVGASPQSRAVLRWPAAALAVLWVTDLNFYTIAYIGGQWPGEFAAIRGLAPAVLACLLAIGATKGGEVLRLKPSRAVAFQTLSLMVIGTYFFAMVGTARWLAHIGGDFARFMELGFLTVASAAALLVLPSARLRERLRVTLAKHLFQHRYDYREEWLRFTRTIGNGNADGKPLGERVVQSVCDIADSPGGLLLTPGDHGDLTLAARWNWPDIEVPGSALGVRSIAFFERESFIADLDDIRTGRDVRGESGHVPEWLRDDPKAWSLVPLTHYDRLVGMVVLARPALARRFDWEDFDLLRVVGQQLATYLAEAASQDALAEASRFDDFHRRIAFVMHDIKNLASQISLLTRNAELHADKKEFRDDMLVTLRNSSEKLNALLARLSRYGTGVVDRPEQLRTREVAQAVLERFRGNPQVLMGESHDLEIVANRHSLEQVLVHLLQNAVDASEPASPVFLSVTSDGLNARFEVIDSGCGMSPEFVRTRLFKPFVSTKSGGFGIGAFEARELVRAMRGRLEVESREGLGSRFIVRLPLAATAGIYANISNSEQEVA